MQVLCLYGLRIWQMQKFMCYCTVFALFYFEFEDNFRVPGGLYLEGQFIGRFLRYEFGGPIFRAIHTWSGLFLEFHGIPYM